MKREDFFEALSDIDENMIAAAGEGSEAVKPVIVKGVTVKKSRIKPLCAAAACVALAMTITAVAVNMNRPSDLSDTPLAENKEYKTVVNVVNGSKYPENLYSTNTDYSQLEMKYIGDFYPEYPCPSKFGSYDELAEYSQLVVMGTFTDDSMQVTEPSDTPNFADAMFGDFSNNYLSFNTLKVEKVLKGNGKVWVGDEIVISQPYVIVEDDACCYSFSQSTPMIKGDKWVYFLEQNREYPEDVYGKQTYSAVNDYEGRYPVPDEENPPFEYRENTCGVVAPAVFNQGIYSELKEKLENAEQSERPPFELEYEKVIGLTECLDSCPLSINVEFEMEEFEGTTFGWQEGALYTRANNSEERNTVIGGMCEYTSLWNTYLCDLTGDGKREICTSIDYGSGIVHGYVWVWDFFNDEVYVLSERGVTNYWLYKMDDGELYLMSQEFSINYDENCEVTSELLTLDMLMKLDPNQKQPENTEQPEETEQTNTKQPENTEQLENTEQPAENFPKKIMDLKDGCSDYLTDMALVFDMYEFPNISFERDPTGKFDDALYLKEGENSRLLLSCEVINSIYLCDLNGDGNREICAGIDVKAWDDSTASSIICPSVAVIDYTDNKSYLLFNQEKNENRNCDYTLKAMDEILYVEKIHPQTDGSILSEPLTLDIFEQEGQVMQGIEIIISIAE